MYKIYFYRDKRGRQPVYDYLMELLSGVKQPVIARMENGTSIPKISTILKILAPLGKTLAIVPLEK